MNAKLFKEVNASEECVHLHCGDGLFLKEQITKIVPDESKFLIRKLILSWKCKNSDSPYPNILLLNFVTVWKCITKISAPSRSLQKLVGLRLNFDWKKVWDVVDALWNNQRDCICESQIYCNVIDVFSTLFGTKL